MTHRHPPPSSSIRDRAHRLGDDTADLDPLLRLAQGRSFVLLGEATHGTHEFYELRARITRRLVDEQGFDAVVVEGDWPDTLHLDAYVRGGNEESIDAAFAAYARFPTWLWANRPVKAFVEWLRGFNASRLASDRVGFYGLDLYSLYRSAEAVIQYLESVDPDQALRARELYRALDHVRDPQGYGYEAARGLRPDCGAAAARLLTQLVRNAPDYVGNDGADARDRQFHAERNAYVVLNAEKYYRAMFEARASTWNLRDAHMANTIAALRRHFRACGRPGRLVVWAHNSHLGDARATEMGARGEWNVGQLLRESFGDQALLVGFTTYTGHVTAARDWELPAERRWVRPARKDSCEHLFYRTGLDRFFLPLRDAVAAGLREPLLERAIGVVYRPETELASHYFHASLPAQFDAVFHLDETTALEPLDIAEAWRVHEPPDGFHADA
jgi:erythromycin esterase-like protein